MKSPAIAGREVALKCFLVKTCDLDVRTNLIVTIFCLHAQFMTARALEPFSAIMTSNLRYS